MPLPVAPCMHGECPMPDCKMPHTSMGNAPCRHGTEMLVMGHRIHGAFSILSSGLAPRTSLGVIVENAPCRHGALPMPAWGEMVRASVSFVSVERK